jgi:hypothetical protein
MFQFLSERDCLAPILRAGVSLAALAWALVCSGASGVSSLSLAWNPSPDPRVVGYELRYGTTSGIYPSRTDVGTNTTGTVPGLTQGLTYYLVVVAYDGHGGESPPSNEVSALIPTNPPPTLTAALDTPSWLWTTGGTGPGWAGQTNLTHDMVDAAQSGVVTNGQTNWLEATVTGPGTLNFWWKVSSETNYDFLRFSTNGVEVARIGGEVGWVQTNFALAPGVQTLRWAYTKDRSVSRGRDAGWLDQVSFTPSAIAALTVASTNPVSGVTISIAPNDNAGQGTGATALTRTYSLNTTVTLTAPATAGSNLFLKWQRDGLDWATTASTTVTMDTNHALLAVYQSPSPPSLAEALDTPGWTWTVGGTGPGWAWQTNLTHDAIDAAQSGVVTNSQTNWMETTVTGPGTLSYWWKVSSETNYDFLRFSTNGVEMARISGEVGWVQTNFALTAGAQTLRWAYTKDKSVSRGQDAAWVDEVSLSVVRAAAMSAKTPAMGLETALSIQGVSTSGAPQLSIECRQGEVKLSWSLSCAGWLVEQTTALDGPASTWLALSSATRQTNATHCSVTVPLPGTLRFYRLRQPLPADHPPSRSQ